MAGQRKTLRRPAKLILASQHKMKIQLTGLAIEPRGKGGRVRDQLPLGQSFPTLRNDERKTVERIRFARVPRSVQLPQQAPRPADQTPADLIDLLCGVIELVVGSTTLAT